MNTLNKIKSTNYNILHAFESWVEKIPEAECLFITKNQKTYTYKQLSELVNKVANGFKSIGIQEGDRIAFALTNCAEYCYGFYGTIKSKAIIVPLNPSFKIEEALYIMQSSEAKIVVTNTNLLPLYKNIRNKYKGLKEIIVVDSETSETDPDVISLNDLLRNSSSQIESPNFASDDVFEIMYTSGTTGKPKGVMLTHIGVWSNARVFIEDMELGPGDKLFTVAPLCFAAAQGAAMHNAFTSGAALYLGESWRGAEDILQTIEKYKITYFFGPPTFWVFILNHPKINDYDLSSLRIGFTGAAPLSVETFNQFKNRFGFEIIEGAGMTETSPLYSINPYRGIKKPGSCGLPIPNTKVKIVDDNDNEVPVGQDGEICFKGIHVMKGYWKMPKETAEAMRGGWFHSGDIGHLDEDGYLYITDRKKDIIIRGGTNIASREVEEALFKHNKVLEAAVIGVPDKVMGEEVKAFIVLKPEVEPTEELANNIKLFVGEHLAKFKVPRYIEFVNELPKTPSGKVMKTELRKRPFEEVPYKKS